MRDLQELTLNVFEGCADCKPRIEGEYLTVKFQIAKDADGNLEFAGFWLLLPDRIQKAVWNLANSLL